MCCPVSARPMQLAAAAGFDTHLSELWYQLAVSKQVHYDTSGSSLHSCCVCQCITNMSHLTAQCMHIVRRVRLSASSLVKAYTASQHLQISADIYWLVLWGAAAHATRPYCLCVHHNSPPLHCSLLLTRHPASCSCCSPMCCCPTATTAGSSSQPCSLRSG